MLIVIHTDEGYDVDFTIPVVFILQFFYTNSYDECWWAGSLEKELTKMVDEKRYHKAFNHDKKLEFFLNMVRDWCDWRIHPVWQVYQIDVFAEKQYSNADAITVGGDESWD